MNKPQLTKMHPIVSITMRLVDVADGATVWQGTSTKMTQYFGSLSRTAQVAEKYALSAADFPAATTQELDEFVVPCDDTPEVRPRPPATWDDCCGARGAS